MSAITPSIPAVCPWSEGDWERAFRALQQVFEDQDWAEEEIRFKQNQIIEHLRQRGIGRALALALIEDLVAHQVFRAGASFVDLKIFVRFDDCQTDEATPNRFLHCTRESWFGYLASRPAPGSLSAPVPSAPLEVPPLQWISLADAERISGINRGVISRAVAAGELASNGQAGKGKRKIDAADFTRWQVERARRPERTESTA
jgi:hypothetical protein